MHALLPHLVVGAGGEAPAQVEGVFVTKAAAGRAVNDASPVFVTLGEQWTWVGVSLSLHCLYSTTVHQILQSEIYRGRTTCDDG